MNCTGPHPQDNVTKQNHKIYPTANKIWITAKIVISSKVEKRNIFASCQKTDFLQESRDLCLSLSHGFNWVIKAMLNVAFLVAKVIFFNGKCYALLLQDSFWLSAFWSYDQITVKNITSTTKCVSFAMAFMTQVKTMTQTQTGKGHAWFSVVPIICITHFGSYYYKFRHLSMEKKSFSL